MSRAREISQKLLHFSSLAEKKTQKKEGFPPCSCIRRSVVGRFSSAHLNYDEWAAITMRGKAARENNHLEVKNHSEANEPSTPSHNWLSNDAQRHVVTEVKGLQFERMTCPSPVNCEVDSTNNDPLESVDCPIPIGCSIVICYFQIRFGFLSVTEQTLMSLVRFNMSDVESCRNPRPSGNKSFSRHSMSRKSDCPPTFITTSKSFPNAPPQYRRPLMAPS